jgi:DNA helicase-2/ATP-dependent DNA helicase PcrA
VDTIPLNSDFTPRPTQSKILRYRGGTLGISAVPGSGKTHILSALAAQIIASGALGVDQEVLIVTLVNSAVDNFSQRIGGFIQQQGLIPHIGYRVRTLHGLAHDIVRETPALVGLENRFAIIDEREAEFIRKEAANAWLASHPDRLGELLDPGLDDSKRDWVHRKQLPELVNGIALSFIRSAKDNRQTPDSLRTQLDSTPLQLPLAEMGWDIYTNYQRALAYRGAVDFDDLIRLALDALEISPELLERLQNRFPYILEDEAQDSSFLQEQILGKLSRGNWVRVGDPNQAIFETFTTAKPEYLLNFIKSANMKEDLPVSGRSQPSIITLANYLIDWVRSDHPSPECQDALSLPYIQSTEPEDPQPNPADNPAGILLIGKKYTPEEEVEAVVKSIVKWLPDNQDKTIAVLVPRNVRGVDVIDALKKHKIEYVEYLASTSTTRAAAGALGNVVAYLADPTSASKLAKVYQVWRRSWRDEESLREEVKKTHQASTEEEIASSAETLKVIKHHTTGLLRKGDEVEAYLSPRPGRDWLETLPSSSLPTDLVLEVKNELEQFREVIRRWQGTTLLPIDQMILTLAQDLFTEPVDLALSHKLAMVLRQATDDHPEWRLPELTAELGVVAKNERRFLGFSADDSGFDPDRHRGKVVVSTMHKAKGLEWYRVYLMSVNNYDFPSGMANDRYISEKWFARGGLNLEAEALAQLHNALSPGEFEWRSEGEATRKARIEYVRERLRLLYVGITRAKNELIITWNTGRMGDQTQSIPFAALQAWWQNQNVQDENI